MVLTLAYCRAFARPVLRFGAALVLLPALAEAQDPSLTTVSVLGTLVTVTGTNLTGTSAVTVADQTLTSLTVNASGTTVMGELGTPLAAGSHLLTLTVSSVPTASCVTVKPGPDWVCIADGWVPPGHPLAVGAMPTPGLCGLS